MENAHLSAQGFQAATLILTEVTQISVESACQKYRRIHLRGVVCTSSFSVSSEQSSRSRYPTFCCSPLPQGYSRRACGLLIHFFLQCLATDTHFKIFLSHW